jgi:hypothetical protein
VGRVATRRRETQLSGGGRDSIGTSKSFSPVRTSDRQGSMHRSASLARVRFTNTESDPSGRRTRYMPGHLVSGTMSGLSVTEGGRGRASTLRGYDGACYAKNRTSRALTGLWGAWSAGLEHGLRGNGPSSSDWAAFKEKPRRSGARHPRGLKHRNA